MTVLRLQGVGVHYGMKRALSGVSCDVAAGDVWAVLGSNGAGKSSLVRAVTGLVPHVGTVELLGRDAASMSVEERAQHVSWVPQELPTEVQFSAVEIVLMGRGGLSWRSPSALVRENALKALEQVGLSYAANTPVHQLSGGERRRVWLARSFFSAQQVLVLDEPTAFLDVAHQRNLLRRVKAESSRGLAVVAVVHDVSLVSGLATHALLLKDGGVLAQGPIAQVLTVENVSTAFDTRMLEVAPGVFLPE